MRSTLGTMLMAVAGLALAVAGTLTVRSDIPGLPDGLWVLPLVSTFLVGLRHGWRAGLAAVAAGAAVLTATFAAPPFQALTNPVLPLWPVLLPAWSAAAALAVLLALYARRRRAAGHLQALTDGATGLPNRRHAELFLEHEFAVAQLGRPMAVLLLDVDGYRAYVASSGTAAGQALLRALATILRRHTRASNLSARWNEDRFVCLLSGTTEEGALIFARKLQEQVRATGGVATVPSVSIGVACYEPDMHDPADLLRAAEAALAAAKHDGGDRIRFHGHASQDAAPLPAESGASWTRPQSEAQADPAAVPVGARSAFVFVRDPAMRRRAAEQLERRGMRVTEVSRAVDGMRALTSEFDVVVVDLSAGDPGVRDLVDEVRRRHPAARVLGVPDYEGDAIRPSSLAVRVDGHLLRTNGSWTFQPSLEELLRERDRLRETALRALHLTDEIRAKEREAQRMRAESEQQMRSLVQSIREVLFRTDRSGAWISLSPAWSTLTGLAIEQSLGRPWLEFFHEDDRDALAREFDALTGIERPYLRREARLLTRTGGVRWVEVRAQLTHDRFGNVLAATGTLTDITERRRVEEALHRSEEYFRALIENAADLIAVVDAAGRFRYASPAAERILGYGESDELPVLEELVHADDVPALRAALRSTDAPGANAALELRARHRDGTWRTLSISIRNLTHIPAVGGWVLNAHDVTGRNEAERALRESEEALFRARKMDAIGMLAGGVAHDFNNLLTSIQGHADMAAGALAPDHPIRADLRNIQDAASRASSLTRQLLAFGRRQVLRPRTLDLNVFISDMHKMLVRLLGDRILLRTELGASPAHVQVDPTQIERAILNLAVNAREAMPRGGTFTIRTDSTLIEGDEARALDLVPGRYILVAISDSGSGIPPAILPHVFDPFFTTKTQTPGAGMGLSTVYGIVRQSGGHVTVESRHDDSGAPGSGSTFTLYLPAARTAAAADRARADATDAPGGTIALVEDEPAVRELASRILRGRGYSVISAENGRHALDLLAAHPSRIDMLVTDVVMPEMNGRDLADRLEMMRPGVKVLFMSGYAPEAVEQHGVIAHGTMFLEKPFSPEGLLQKVQQILEPAPGPGSAVDGEAGPAA